ncbi:MAG: DUF1127 domain-containing protein [Paracoccus sp. (in: a-proteobacteria)]
MTAMVSHYSAAPESPFAGLVARFNAWNARRVTRNELNRLSERELEDIGLCRADIETVVSAI